MEQKNFTHCKINGRGEYETVKYNLADYVKIVLDRLCNRGDQKSPKFKEVLYQEIFLCSVDRAYWYNFRQ